MKNYLAKTLICFLILTPALIYAAMAPKSIETLTKDATLIVSGEIIEVTSKIEAAKADPGFFNKDKFLSIKLKVSKVLKGNGVKPGETITLVTWRFFSRPFWHAGPQGIDTVPQKGDLVTVYIKGKNGNNFIPILPNGIAISEKVD